MYKIISGSIALTFGSLSLFLSTSELFNIPVADGVEERIAFFTNIIDILDPLLALMANAVSASLEPFANNVYVCVLALSAAYARAWTIVMFGSSSGLDEAPFGSVSTVSWAPWWLPISEAMVTFFLSLLIMLFLLLLSLVLGFYWVSVVFLGYAFIAMPLGFIDSLKRERAASSLYFFVSSLFMSITLLCAALAHVINSFALNAT